MVSKECFGVLDRVFPRGEEGLRQVPQQCFACSQHTECLKAALASPEGVRFRMELLESRRPSGVFGRLKRWSEKKALSRSLKDR